MCKFQQSIVVNMFWCLPREKCNNHKSNLNRKYQSNNIRQKKSNSKEVGKIKIEVRRGDSKESVGLKNREKE